MKQAHKASKLHTKLVMATLAAKEGKRMSDNASANKAEKTVATVNEPMQLIHVPLDQIDADEDFNARKSYNEDLVQTLVADIKKNGLINPLLVRRNKKGRYDLISGFTRLKALLIIEKEARKEGAKSQPVMATARLAPADMDDAQAHLLNLGENALRKNLTAYEIAAKAHLLRTKFELSSVEIGKSVEKGTKYINNLIRIMDNVHPKILAEWQQNNGKATVDWLLKRAVTDPPIPHDEQWEQWLQHCGLIPESDDEDTESGGKGDKGEKEDKEGPAKRRPGKNTLDAAMAAVRKAEGKSKDWKDGAIAALRFAAGEHPTIPAVYDPKRKATASKNGARAEA